MQEKQIIEAEKFPADDADGNTYIIVKLQTQVRLLLRSGQYTPWTNGTHEWRTIDNLHVEPLDEDTFEILNINTVVRRLP